MTSCCFKSCKNSTRNTNKEKGVTFHSFPQDPYIKQEWISIVQTEHKDDRWLPTKFSKMCSSHFKENEIFLTLRGQRRIKASALPAFQLSTNGETIGGEKGGCVISGVHSVLDTQASIFYKRRMIKAINKNKSYKREIQKFKVQNKRLKRRNTHLNSLIQNLKETLLEVHKKLDERNSKTNDKS